MKVFHFSFCTTSDLHYLCIRQCLLTIKLLYINKVYKQDIILKEI